MSAPSSTKLTLPPKAAPQKLRLHCSSCSTLCEVQIPAMDPTRKKPVRFQIKCPRCSQAFVDFTGCFALSCSRCAASKRDRVV